MDSRSVRSGEGQAQGSDVGAEGEVRNNAEVGLSRKIWGVISISTLASSGCL